MNVFSIKKIISDVQTWNISQDTRNHDYISVWPLVDVNWSWNLTRWTLYPWLVPYKTYFIWDKDLKNSSVFLLIFSSITFWKPSKHFHEMQPLCASAKNPLSYRRVSSTRMTCLLTVGQWEAQQQHCCPHTLRHTHPHTYTLSTEFRSSSWAYSWLTVIHW